MIKEKIVVIGLDACDPATARRMAARGEMPNLAKLLESSSRCAVKNNVGVFVSSVWVSMATGVRPDRHNYHCWDVVDPKSYKRRPISPDVRQKPFWVTIGEAGRRVVAVDVPHSRVQDPVNGVAVVEWGGHDRHFGFHTYPPERLTEISERFGTHPILGIDPFVVRDFASDDYAHRGGDYRTVEEDRALIDGFLEGIARKRRMLSSLIEEEDWDLFVAVYGDSHGIGHQQWHLHDPRHPRFDAAVQQAIGGDPVARVYAALDEAVGELVAQAGDDATIFVLLSHGMGAHYDGTHLLEEVLARLDRCHSDEIKVPHPREAARRALQAVRPAAERAASAFNIRKDSPILARIFGARPFALPEQRARQRFYLAPNNTVYGGIRLNLIGREPNGQVAPQEVSALVLQLEKDLKEIVNVETGGPWIRSLTLADDHYRRSENDTLPDIFVDWERSALVTTVRSPKIGTVHAPYFAWRTGDHRPTGLLLARGKGLEPGKRMPSIAMEDLPVSVAARLGVELQDVDGVISPWLAERTGRAVSSAVPSELQRHS